MAQWESQKLKYNSQTGKYIHDTMVQVDRAGVIFARPLMLPVRRVQSP